MYKAVFLDLDGTLLDDEKNISEENKKAIEYVRSKGALVCVCTGRQMDISKKFKEMAGASRYIIYSNGTGIYDCDKNENLFFASIPRAICLELYKLVEKNNIFIRLDTKYGRYINDASYLLNTEIVLEDKESEKFFIDNDVLQITIGCKEEKFLDKISDCVKRISNDIKIENKFKNDNVNGKLLWSINIINVSASKGNAIQGLCKYLKIDTNDVIAIGDDMNDISMIKNVGLGIAMGNSIPSLKDYAKEVTKSNIENGVAEVLLNKF